jgi:epoxyqueuosine reductase QueG
MSISIEQKIKDFVRSQGVDVVGVAGPDRLDGPPSLDPTYYLKGARSIVSMIVPMDGQAIHDFLGKKSPVPHWVDQVKKNQQMCRISGLVADYIRSLGYKAVPVHPNTNYRRHPYIYSVLPIFSHRFGAIAAGIAGQGWSGNVMTEEYGGSTYIGTVVTDAVLNSDPLRYDPRHFIDGYCRKCNVCSKTCASGMFREHEEEYVLLNDVLYPRGKRQDINLCAATCFGLHGLSRDRKWTTWAWRWNKKFMKKPSENISKLEAMIELTIGANTAGDSYSRFNMIKAMSYEAIPDELLNEYLDKHPENMDQKEHEKALFAFAEKLGINGLRDQSILTCGQCGLVCGPTLEETAERYKLVVNGGLVVRGPNGKMVNAPTYEEALKIRELPKLSKWEVFKDGAATAYFFNKKYFGFEPKATIQGFKYGRRLKKAVAARIKGHKHFDDAVVNTQKLARAQA